MERSEAELIIGKQIDYNNSLANTRVLNGISVDSTVEQVEEALQVLSESRSDCSCGNGTQMFFWLPSVEQKKFLERLEGVKIRDDLVSHIILWCTKNKKIEMPEDELDSLFGRAFNWKPSKI